MPATAQGQGNANGALLQAALDAAVPLRVADLQAAGGPTAWDWERARLLAPDLVARGDVLLYRSAKRGEGARLFAELAHAIAVLSFAPGGITVFGRQWRSGD